MFPESNKPPEVKNWDKARETPPSIDTGEAVKAEYWVVLERVAKAISYVVTFFIVLGCAIVSKSSTLFMLKQIAVNPNNIPFCNEGRRGNPYIPDNGTEVEYEVDFQCDLTGEEEACHQELVVERVGWVWAVAFAFTVPQVGGLIRSVLLTNQRPVPWSGDPCRPIRGLYL